MKLATAVLIAMEISFVINGDITVFFSEHFFEDQLPFSIRVLLESAVRNCDEFLVKKDDVEKILNWKVTQSQTVEVPFRPARVILQDFT